MDNEEASGLAEALDFAADERAAVVSVQTIIETDGESELGVVRTILPPGYSSEILDLEKYAAHPRRKNGKVILRGIGSFMEYVGRHKGPGTAVYRDGRRFTAILDGHEPGLGLAGWGGHTAMFEPLWTPGWTAWSGFANKAIPQEDFARFLEDRIPEIARPDGAVVFEAVANLRLHWEARYERVINPSVDYANITFVEEEKAGQFRVPTTFDLVVVPFEGADALAIEGVRLSVSRPNQNQKLTFTYRLPESADRAVDRLFTERLADVRESVGVDTYWGTFSRG